MLRFTVPLSTLPLPRVCGRPHGRTHSVSRSRICDDLCCSIGSSLAPCAGSHVALCSTACFNYASNVLAQLSVHRVHRLHPHQRQDDWAHPCHICGGTGLTPPTSAPGLGSAPTTSAPDGAAIAAERQRRRISGEASTRRHGCRAAQQFGVLRPASRSLRGDAAVR